MCDVFDEAFGKCFIPKAYKWNSSLVTLLKDGQIEHVQYWFQLMKSITSIEVETRYNIMIDSLCMQRKFNEGLVLWQEMHELGLKPTQFSMLHNSNCSTCESCKSHPGTRFT